MISKLLCKLFGHRRGRRTGIYSDKGAQFRCSRCGAVWNRKVKVKA